MTESGVIFHTNQRRLILQLSEANLRFSEGRSAHASNQIIDHDYVTRDAVSRLLIDNAYNAQTSESGDAALDQFCDSLPNLVLRIANLTANLPGQDGLKILRTIRQGHSEFLLSVIMVTTETEAYHVVRAFREGASDFLALPFDDEILLARV